jgi:hypothetical protein
MRRTKNLMVYQYEFWDEARMMMRTSDTYATLDAIMKGLGIPLLYTGKVVPRVAIFHELVGALR